MPTEMSSWADEIDETDTSTILPAPSEKWVGNQKITTEYSLNDEGKKVKIIRTFKIEKKLVSKSVAKRKGWQKFGMSRNDRPGPDRATTLIPDDVFMHFVHNKEECDKDSSDVSGLQQLAEGNKSIFKCRICKDDHMTAKCPYRDTHGLLKDSLLGLDRNAEGGSIETTKLEAGKGASITSSGTNSTGLSQGATNQTNVYVPPSKRGGDSGRISASMPGRDTEIPAVRVSNLSENTQEEDMRELFGKFGSIARIYLAKEKFPEKNTQAKCKGFAFINYHKKDDAAKAIATLNGFGYDHLILNVEWAKPSGT